MKRVLALATAATLLAAAPALAQSAPTGSIRTAVNQPARPDFSAQTAGIKAMAAASSAPSAARRAPAVPQASRRSFWKTPWPYVIIGGVVAAGVIIASADGDGIY